MRRLIRKTTAVWERDEGFSILLALLIASLFVAPLVREEFPRLATATAGLSYLVFVVGALVVARTVWGALAVSVLAGAAIALEVVHQVDASDPLVVWRLSAACLVFGLFALVTLARVFAPGPVTSHRLVGAVAAYLLVGVTWAHAYGLIEAVRHGSFQAAGGPVGAYPRFLYYSFVTLTTVGYGDITPVSSAARSLSNLESLVGVLYPAILIGRLLSKQGVGTPPEPPAAG
jgi:hypothetical protein